MKWPFNLFSRTQAPNPLKEVFEAQCDRIDQMIGMLARHMDELTKENTDLKVKLAEAISRVEGRLHGND